MMMPISNFCPLFGIEKKHFATFYWLLRATNVIAFIELHCHNTRGKWKGATTGKYEGRLRTPPTSSATIHMSKETYYHAVFHD